MKRNTMIARIAVILSGAGGLTLHDDDAMRNLLAASMQDGVNTFPVLS